MDYQVMKKTHRLNAYLIQHINAPTKRQLLFYKSKQNLWIKIKILKTEGGNYLPAT